MDIVSCTEGNALNIRYHTLTVRSQYSPRTTNPAPVHCTQHATAKERLRYGSEVDNC